MMNFYYKNTGIDAESLTGFCQNDSIIGTSEPIPGKTALTIEELTAECEANGVDVADVLRWAVNETSIDDSGLDTP